MYLSSPPGHSSPSTTMITRRRLKALPPVLIALLLIPFFISAFHVDSDQSLLTRARQLYNKDGGGRMSFQANMNLPPSSEDGIVPAQEETMEPVAGVNVEETSDVATAADFETAANFETVADFNDLGYSNDSGPGDSALDYDLQQSTDPDDDYFRDHDYTEADFRPKKSLLDLMDFPETNETIATIPDRGDYRELFSLTTRDRQFMPVFIEGAGVYDANLIPHPTKFDMWIVLAQGVQRPEKYTVAEQIMCTAGFLQDVLVCAEPFENITLSSFVTGVCEGDLAYFNDYIGARDARMFYGPEAPYVFYGSQSQYTCSGMWLQDARTLLEPFHIQRPLTKVFGQATEVQRRPPQKGVETDYFLFWDADGKAYAHYQAFYP